ncbi:MAG: hypothetical protein M1343_09900 [Chloroflexi bacterium]|nr:hypothetical protein [Chloroflexota bacterium]
MGTVDTERRQIKTALKRLKVQQDRVTDAYINEAMELGEYKARMVFGGNGYMSNTEERIHTGVFKGEGMSPGADKRRGGASYFFTRIKAQVEWNAGHPVFDKRLLLRSDNISYDVDYYGAADEASKQRRAADIAGWKSNANSVTNETITKNGFSALNYIVRINSQGRRSEILDLLRQHGITRLNGRKIEDIVV